MNEQPEIPKEFLKVVKVESTPDYVGIVVAKFSPVGKLIEQKGMKLLAAHVYEQVIWQEAADKGDITKEEPK